LSSRVDGLVERQATEHDEHERPGRKRRRERQVIGQDVDGLPDEVEEGRFWFVLDLDGRLRAFDLVVPPGVFTDCLPSPGTLRSAGRFVLRGPVRGAAPGATYLRIVGRRC
jgi:hypothetical protein